MPYPIFKQLLTGFLASYFFYIALHPEAWTILNSINLVIHEAGHTIFFFLGEFFQVAAGSLFQIILPFTFVLYFWLRQEKFSASLLLFWVGENILEVARYAADAQTMALPLLGGDGVIHDWNYLLSELNLLTYTHFISQIITICGLAVISLAFFFGLYYANKK